MDFTKTGIIGTPRGLLSGNVPRPVSPDVRLSYAVFLRANTLVWLFSPVFNFF